MALLERLLGPSRQQLGRYSPNRYPLSQTPGVFFSGPTSSAGVDVDQESAMSLSAVFAAVNKLSSIIAALPLSVYQNSGKSREVATTHKVQRLLHTQYNEEMSAFIGRRTSEFHRILWGNAYTEIELDGAYRPVALWPVEPWRVKQRREPAGLYFEVDSQKRVLPGKMLHETFISGNGIEGESFIDYACESLGLSIAAQEFSARFFGNDATPGGVLSHDMNPDPKQREEFRESWGRHHTGPQNAFKTAVIWGGWKYQAERGSITPQDAQLLEARRFSTEEVSRWLNIPPHILYDLSRSTNNNIEHQGIEFIQHCLNPILVQKEQQYDCKLLMPPKLYCKHNVTALLRGDSAARGEFYSKLFSIGMLSPNEGRALEELNPIGPEGDTYFVPVNTVPIDRAINPPEPPPPVVQPPKDNPPNDPPQDPPANDPPADNGQMKAALRSLLSDTFGRLMRKEINEGKRAAKKPKEFLAWLDSFYPEFEGTLSAAIDAPLAAVNASGVLLKGGERLPAGLSIEYCTRSREALLELAGNATAANLAEKAEAEFAAWEKSRAINEAQRIIP